MRIAQLPLLSLAASALLLAGCATTRAPHGPSLGTTIAVMDFQVPQGAAGAPEIHGWWLSSRDVMSNPNAGSQAADEFTRQLSRVPSVTAIPRVRLKYYFADKRALLENELGKLSDHEALENFHRTPPEAFAKQLGADLIIRGRLNKSYTARNRTIDHFWSGIDLRAEVYDGATGKLIWHGEESKTKQWGTTVDLTKRAIAELISRFDHEYFLAPQPN